MATNIGNKLSKSGTDLFFATLGMPNTSEGMYKTVTYCDTYTGMEGAPIGTVKATATYSKTQSDMVVGKHIFSSTSGQHTNIWTWNENSNSSGSNAGGITGTFKLTPTSNISTNGGTLELKPSGLTISTSPNTTSTRFIDEPITVTIGTHASTYDYGGTVSFTTADTWPKGIAQNFYNRDAPYYKLNVKSDVSWATPASQAVSIYDNSPENIALSIAAQSLATNPNYSLHCFCTSPNSVSIIGETKTLKFNAWNGDPNAYTGFPIPSCSSRTATITYEVTPYNSATTPSGLTGTLSLTQEGKTASISYFYSCDSDFVTLSSTGGEGGSFNTVDIKFDENEGMVGNMSGTIKFDDTSDIQVAEYESMANKTGPTASVGVTGWTVRSPTNALQREATIAYEMQWTNVDVDNTTVKSGSYTFVQPGTNYSMPLGDIVIQISGNDMSYYPRILKANQESLPGNPVAPYSARIANFASALVITQQLDIQFPYFRADSVGGSANGTILGVPTSLAETRTYISASDKNVLSIPLTSNVDFVNQNTPAHDSMEWNMRISSFDVKNGTSMVNIAPIPITLIQEGNEYESSTKTEVAAAGGSSNDWITASSGIATFNDSQTSANADFTIENNNAYIGAAYLHRTPSGSIYYIRGYSKNTDSRTGTISWISSNSGDGTVTLDNSSTTYTQPASVVQGHIDLTFAGTAIIGGSYTYACDYPTRVATTTMPYASKYWIRNNKIFQRNKNWYTVGTCNVLIDDEIDYSDTSWTARFNNMPVLHEAPATAYTFTLKTKDLYIGDTYFIKDYTPVDSSWNSYVYPVNAYEGVTYTIPSLTNTYTIQYRYTNNSDISEDVPDDDSSAWSEWKTWPKTNGNYNKSITIAIDSNEGTTYAAVCTKNTGNTLQGGWKFTSSGRSSTEEKTFAIQTKVYDTAYSTAYTHTSSDYFWQLGDEGESNGDKISFTLSSTSNCSVSGNYATLQVGSSIPSSVSISPNYSSGTQSWYKDGNYYGTSEPTPIYSTSWSGSICSNTNNNGASTIPIWADLSNYDRVCGVTGGTSSYTKTVSSPSFTRYYTYPWSATMYPTGYSSLSKTQSGTQKSSTETVQATSSSTVYNRYVSWDGGSTWGTTLTKRLFVNNYSLSWQWKYATSTSASALYSGSGSCSVTKATSSNMAFNGSMTLTGSDGTIYQTQSQTVTCSISNNTTSGTETSAGQTRTVSTTTRIYYSLDNSIWTEGSSCTFSTTTSTLVGNHIIYWKCVATASGYSSSSKTFTGTSTVNVLQRYTTETKTETEYRWADKEDATPTKTYRGASPTVSISGGGNIDYWTSSKTVSASNAGNVNVTVTTGIKQDYQSRTVEYTRTYDNVDKVYTTDWTVVTGSESPWVSTGTERDYVSDTSIVTGSLTTQYSLNGTTWTNGNSYTVTPTSVGSDGSTLGTPVTVYFRALLYYGSTLVTTGAASSVSVAKYGVSYYNQ